MEQEFEDDWMRNTVVKGQRTLPSPDFEDRMMLKINAESKYRRKIATSLTTSLRFFIVGVALGIGLTIYALWVDIVTVYYSKTLVTLLLFVVCVFGVMNIDTYRKRFSKRVA